MMTLGIALAVLTNSAQAPQAPMADATYGIRRIFKPDEKTQFNVKVTLETPGEPTDISGLVTEKVTKVLEGKKANIAFSVADLKSSMPSDGEPGDFQTVSDEHGVGSPLGDGGAHIVMSALEVLSAVPAADLRVGGAYTFDIKMTNAELNVKGTLKDIKDVEGRKIALLEWTGTLRPDGQEFELKVKSQVDIANGRLYKAECTLDSGQVGGKIVIDEKKPA